MGKNIPNCQDMCKANQDCVSAETVAKFEKVFKPKNEQRQSRQLNQHYISNLSHDDQMNRSRSFERMSRTSIRKPSSSLVQDENVHIIMKETDIVVFCKKQGTLNLEMQQNSPSFLNVIRQNTQLLGQMSDSLPSCICTGSVNIQVQTAGLVAEQNIALPLLNMQINPEFQVNPVMDLPFDLQTFKNRVTYADFQTVSTPDGDMTLVKNGRSVNPKATTTMATQVCKIIFFNTPDKKNPINVQTVMKNLMKVIISLRINSIALILPDFDLSVGAPLMANQIVKATMQKRHDLSTLKIICANQKMKEVFAKALLDRQERFKK